ncbi:hypothetical protein [Acetobacter persici]|uniref:hypothetical protein n=1 Tax=Acetobacter persici TaxID=1076596 RepID=UPI001BABBA04|nr:hypothetical protein [Acetobacter persici]MBS1016498.1 hypothetical protein [Acetobacter persici]
MKRYLIELALCITLYVCACVAAAWLRANLAISPAWQPVIALLPMVPGACFLLIIMRYFRRIDELERRIQAESLMFSFSGTAIITFSYGFLETAGFARLSMFCVWPVMAILWSIGYFVSKRRYQ